MMFCTQDAEHMGQLFFSMWSTILVNGSFKAGCTHVGQMLHGLATRFMRRTSTCWTLQPGFEIQVSNGGVRLFHLEAGARSVWGRHRYPKGPSGFPHFRRVNCSSIRVPFFALLGNFVSCFFSSLKRTIAGWIFCQLADPVELDPFV